MEERAKYGGALIRRRPNTMSRCNELGGDDVGRAAREDGKAPVRVRLSDDDYLAAVRELSRVEGALVHYKILARCLGVHPSTAWYRLRKLYYKGLLPPVLSRRDKTPGLNQEVIQRCEALR